MAHNERFEELAALAALGLPLGDEAGAFAAHLEEPCETCEALLGDLRLASSALSVEAPPRRPSPEVRAKILDSIASAPAKAAPPARPHGTSSLPWWLAAAAAILCVVILWDDSGLRREREDLRSRTAQLTSELSRAQAEAARRDLRVRVLESDDVKVLSLGGKDPQPSARAKVFWSEKAKTGVILAGNLAPLPPDKQYELWVFAEGKPVAAGVFDSDTSGRALFESRNLPGIAAAQNFAVTVEPRGGVPQPTGPIILVGTPAA